MHPTCAILHLPAQMEGANLYDVFQKISKGVYAPLPADHFSPTLQNLVTSMLEIDPANRPELEQVGVGVGVGVNVGVRVCGCACACVRVFVCVCMWVCV